MFHVDLVNISEDKINQEFKLKKQMKQDIISLKKYNKMVQSVKNKKKVYGVLNYIEHLLILVSTLTGCVSISAFDQLIGFAIGICSRIKNLCNNYRNQKI